MKKILSLIVVLTMVICSVFSVSASHHIWMDFPHNTEFLYLDRVKEHIGVHSWVEDLEYSEFCHYSDENSEEPDWVLMITSILPEPWVCFHGALVGDRALYTEAGGGLSPFYTGLCVYIPKTDTFIDLDNDHIDQIIELCPDFVETIEKNRIGSLIGDVYQDGIVNILDATVIQRELAQMYIGNNCNYGIEMIVRSGSKPFALSDFDRDGEISVIDATAIQSYCADLDTTI